MVRISELRQMNDEQLNTQINDLKEEMFNLRFQRAAFKNPNPARFGQIKKTIAQIKTLQREREIDKLQAQVSAAKTAQQ
jgi:large subunit ribosomal protein L29